MISIYSIETAFMALDDMLEASQGEITPEIEAYMKEIGAAMVDKAFALQSLRDMYQGNAKLAKDMADDYADKAKKLLARDALYKKLIIRAMQASGKTSITDGIRKISLVENPLRVDVIDETKIPASYLSVELRMPYADYQKIKGDVSVIGEVTLVPDKKQLGELYKASEFEVAGVVYMRDPNIRVK